MIDYINSFLNPILWWPSKHQILYLPADDVLHVCVGAVVFFLLRAVKLSPILSALIVLAAAIFKELFFDLSATLHTHDYIEPFKDVLTSVAVPALVIHKTKVLNFSRALRRRVVLQFSRRSRED